MPVGRPGAMRRDAQRNRDAIVRAAAELFTTAAPDVPLVEIARRAGVGQATVYRHFPDRTCLAMAICETTLHRLEDLAAAEADPADRFELLFDAVVRCLAANRTLVTLVRSGPSSPRHVRLLTRRLSRMFAGPLRDAQAAGRLRPDLSPADVILIFTMIEGMLGETADRQLHLALTTRAAELIRAGLTARVA